MVLLLYRRDSFITHRAFCDALAEESARSHNQSKKQNQEILTRKKPVPDPKSSPNPAPSTVAPLAIPVETQSTAKIKSSPALKIKRSGKS